MRILYNSLEVPHVLNTKLGELIYNKHDKVLYTKDKYLNILKIATGGSGNGVNGKDGKDGRDGVSFNIQGTDTYANIIAKPNPKKGDMWIASDRSGHGIVYNGIRWTDVGQITGDKGDKGDQGITGVQGNTGTDGKSAYDVWLSQGNSGTVQDFFIALEGQQGVQGQKGMQGTGIHFENSYATKADMIAANPNPAIGDTHLVTATGDMWTWDNPTPPHDPAGAIWNDIGHVQGPQGNAGVQGIGGPPGHDGQPGVDGKDGDPLQLATSAETIAGTVADKANTPEGANAAYVSKQRGGVFAGYVSFVKNPAVRYDPVTLKAMVNFTSEDGQTIVGDIGYSAGSTSVQLVNPRGYNNIHLKDKGEILINAKAHHGITLTADKVTATNALQVLGATDLKALTATHIATQGVLDGKKGAAIDWKVGRAGALVYLYSATGASYVALRDNGDIDIVPKVGARGKVRGKNILTGKLTGTTLHLDF